MDEDKVVVTHREQSYVERYVDGELSKMMKQITAINEKYPEIVDIYTGFVKSFFADDVKNMMLWKKKIQQEMKKRKGK